MDFSSGVCCDDCGKVFHTEKVYLKHLNQYHLKRNGGSVCETCGKEFLNDFMKNNHVNQAHVKKECKICGELIAAGIFARHCKSVPSEPLKCDKCIKSFTRKDLLSKHLKICCVAKEKYKCNVCTKTFEIKINFT